MKDNTSSILQTISEGRERTNILRKYEQNTIAFLVQRIPSWISSDMLTGIGLFGNLLVAMSFILATYFNKYYLLIGVLGFMISWFGDSLDGRIAYFRKKARKWYGFTLDITTDWIGIIFIGLGFMVYVESEFIWLGYAFIVLYGWEMLTAAIRYKITGKYSIDSGLMGPTEVRIIISILLILEVLITGSIIYIGIITNIGLLVSNIINFTNLLKQADQRDKIKN
ncbi:MAG: CDP-alcohol phosphatidyltransferase family protein [Bacteroidetes bacterium]|jgi:phosphatidylglycerophosphate synthase|nr:CDP-alcohol phosphatidyltransferase family protein [Bacteroidota bacterium]MBT4340262.1 CDP-alcohol phosphatidyltransferase family protein [Bacteroidota bacterium]MBT4728868.1 CDP-alcohol phosphatidyltransferase family protein [Bacteroidota bacterium]MBT6686238.1 CDP-alcohol phosphatidyltransferase family protein [Bacteroidota bacterium]MBT7994008.1 CDP-alcohol phosphatidyltransferase family protein [Bacteroidota bacterium]